MVVLFIVLASLIGYLAIGRAVATYDISVFGKTSRWHGYALKYSEDPNGYSFYKDESERYKKHLREHFIAMNILWAPWMVCRGINMSYNNITSISNKSIDAAIAKHDPVLRENQIREIKQKQKDQAKELARLEKEYEQNRVPDVLDELEKL